jgi:hypothetical protein
MQFHLRTLADFVALVGVLLVAFSLVGAPVKLALRAIGVTSARRVPAPTIGIAISVLGCWYWASPFGGTKPMLVGLLVGASVVTLGACAVALRRDRGVLRTIARDGHVRSSALIGVICFVGLGVAFVATDTQLFTRTHFTVLTLGDNDAPSYALEAQHMLDDGPKDPGNLVGFNAGVRSLGFSNGAYAALASAAAFTGQDVWRVMSAALFTVLLVGAYTLALLLRQVLGAGREAVAAAASVIGFSVLYVAYLVAQWFFAQLVGMALVLGVVLTLYGAVRAWRRRDAIAAVVVVALLLAAGLSVYPHMVVVGSITLLPIAAIAHESVRAFVRRGVRAGLVFGGGLVLGALAAPGLVVDAIDITKELEGVEAGWSLPSIFPTEMLGFQTSATAGQSWLTAAVSVAVVAALVAGAGLAWRRGRGAAALPLVMGMAAVLLTYFVVYQREGGPTYRQWKWVTFFIPVFVACAICTASLLVEALGPRWPAVRRVAGPAFGVYAVVVVMFASGAGFPLGINAPNTYLSVTLDQINLRDNPVIETVPELHVNTTPYWESMWIAYFLRDQTVTLAAVSYYAPSPPLGPWYLERNDAPLAPGAEATPINETYRLVRMPA